MYIINIYSVLTGERLPIIKNAVRVESNKKAILFSALLLSGDESRISGVSRGCSIDEEDELEISSKFTVSNFDIFFELDQDE